MTEEQIQRFLVGELGKPTAVRFQKKLLDKVLQMDWAGSVAAARRSSPRGGGGGLCRRAVRRGQLGRMSAVSIVLIVAVFASGAFEYSWSIPVTFHVWAEERSRP